MKILVVNDLEKRLVNRMVLLNNHRILKYYLNCLVVKFCGLKLIDVGTKDSSEINGAECHKLLKGIQIIFYFLEQQQPTILSENGPSDKLDLQSDIKYMNHMKDASLLENSKFYVIPAAITKNKDENKKISEKSDPSSTYSFNGYEMTTLDVAINILDYHISNPKLKSKVYYKDPPNSEKLFFSDNQIKRI